MARDKKTKRGRGGEAGFTVLEAVLALAITLGAALAAVEAFRASMQSGDAARSSATAMAAAEAALARIGSDLPVEPGGWESEVGGVRVRIALTPFEAEATPLEQKEGFSIGSETEAPLGETLSERRRSSRGRALLATVLAEARGGGGRPAAARLSRVVVGPADDAGDRE